MMRKIPTKQEMLERLKALGLKKSFKPYTEAETGALLLQVRKPAQIVEGLLKGSEICLQGKLFRVWTPRKQVVRALAKQHGLSAQLLDGEAVLWIPAELADEILPKFGAKVKKACNLTPEERLAQTARMRLARQNSLKKGTASTLNCPEGVSMRGGTNG